MKKLHSEIVLKIHVILVKIVDLYLLIDVLSVSYGATPK